jgi:hypothetical protein
MMPHMLGTIFQGIRSTRDDVAREARSISAIQVISPPRPKPLPRHHASYRRQEEESKKRVRMMRWRKITKGRMYPMMTILSLFLDIPGIRRRKPVALLLRPAERWARSREAIELVAGWLP